MMREPRLRFPQAPCLCTAGKPAQCTICTKISIVMANASDRCINCPGNQRPKTTAAVSKLHGLVGTCTRIFGTFRLRLAERHWAVGRRHLIVNGWPLAVNGRNPEVQLS